MTRIPGRTPTSAAPRAAEPAASREVPGGRKKGAVTDALETSSRGGDAARPRAQTNQKVKRAMSGFKKAGIAAIAVAVLVGGAFTGYQRFVDTPAPDPAPVVVPVERPAMDDAPVLPTDPVNVKPIEEVPVDPGGGAPALPGGGPDTRGDPGASGGPGLPGGGPGLPNTPPDAPDAPSAPAVVPGLEFEPPPTIELQPQPRVLDGDSTRAPVSRLDDTNRATETELPRSFRPWERPNR